MSIKSIKARQIFDSRGNPTIEVDLVTEKGMFRAAVPSGASTGIHEALELRDKDPMSYHGKGVAKAIEIVNKTIASALVGKADIDVANQSAMDEVLLALDGTENKSTLGANPILGVSLAICKAGAAKKGLPLYKHIAELAGVKEFIMPVPSLNVINRGSHAGIKLTMQEFMILPTGAHNFREAMKMASEVYHHLKNVIKEKYGQDACNVGDGGGFSPNIHNIEEGLELIMSAIKMSGYAAGRIEIGINVAASEFFKNGKYDSDLNNPKSDASKHLTAEELLDVYEGLASKYPIVTIEEGSDLHSWEALIKMTATMNSMQVVGRDLLMASPKRLKQYIEKKVCNCLLLKVNEFQSVTETIQTCKVAQAAGWGCMVSNDIAETEDTFIADLVIGLGTGQIKSGALCRSELCAKYNQLLRIEEELGQGVTFAGNLFHSPMKLLAVLKKRIEEIVLVTLPLIIKHADDVMKRLTITTTYQLTFTQLSQRALSQHLFRLLEKAKSLCQYHDDFDEANHWNEIAVSRVVETLEELQRDFIDLKLSNLNNLILDKFEYHYNLDNYLDETELILSNNCWTRFRLTNNSEEPISGAAELAYLVIKEAGDIDNILSSVTAWIQCNPVHQNRQGSLVIAQLKRIVSYKVQYKRFVSKRNEVILRAIQEEPSFKRNRELRDFDQRMKLVWCRRIMFIRNSTCLLSEFVQKFTKLF